MESLFNIYATDHIHSRTVCQSLSQGTKFPIVPINGGKGVLQPGGVIMYGFLRGLLPLLDQARTEGRAWGYVDRGYFRASRGTDYSGFFRVTRNAFQLDGINIDRMPRDRKRWEALSLKLLPWRSGKHILVCPPGEVWMGALGNGVSAQAWFDQTMKALAEATDRPVRVRRKPADIVKAKPLIEDLQDCHALVTHCSNTAVEAILAGVPTFCTGRCAGRYIACDLREVDNPIYFDREPWVEALAANQWTLEELRAGKANHLF